MTGGLFTAGAVAGAVPVAGVLTVAAADAGGAADSGEAATAVAVGPAETKCYTKLINMVYMLIDHRSPFS